MLRTKSNRSKSAYLSRGGVKDPPSNFFVFGSMTSKFLWDIEKCMNHQNIFKILITAHKAQKMRPWNYGRYAKKWKFQLNCKWFKINRDSVKNIGLWAQFCVRGAKVVLNFHIFKKLYDHHTYGTQNWLLKCCLILVGLPIWGNFSLKRLLPFDSLLSPSGLKGALSRYESTCVGQNRVWTFQHTSN